MITGIKASWIRTSGLVIQCNEMLALYQLLNSLMKKMLALYQLLNSLMKTCKYVIIIQ